MRSQKTLGERLLRVNPDAEQAIGEFQQRLRKRFDYLVTEAAGFLEQRAQQILLPLSNDLKLYSENLKQIVFEQVNNLILVARDNPIFFEDYCEEMLVPVVDSRDVEIVQKVQELEKYDLMAGINIHFARVVGELNECLSLVVLSSVILNYVRRGVSSRSFDLLKIEQDVAAMNLRSIDLLVRVEQLEQENKILREELKKTKSPSKSSEGVRIENATVVLTGVQESNVQKVITFEEEGE